MKRILLQLLPLLALAAARSRDDEDTINTTAGFKEPGSGVISAREDHTFAPEDIRPGNEDGSSHQAENGLNTVDDPKYDVVEAKRAGVNPGNEGPKGEDYVDPEDEDSTIYPPKYQVVEVARRAEGDDNDEPEDENSPIYRPSLEVGSPKMLPDRDNVVLAKRDTLAKGYDLMEHQVDLTNPPKVTKRAEGDFNIGDLVDLTSMQQQISSKFTGDHNDAAANKDIQGMALNPEDFHQADMVKEVQMDFEEDPILLARLWEGDIANVLPTDLKQMMGAEEDGRGSRNAIKSSWRRWPNAIIPYVISSEFSQHERSVIAKAMQHYHTKTCIRFRPRTSEKAYIHVMKGSGCSSSVGRTGSRQTVSLGNGCVYTGIVQHELMHASGFWHEQSRADRDGFVTINWNNIMSGMEYNFLKYDLNKIDHLGAKYDTCSVMHYGATSFAKSWGKKTIVSKHSDDECELGQRKGFSDTDIRKLNTLYKCKGYPQVGGSGSITATPKPTVKPKPVKPVKPTCEDGNKHCAYWAGKDECKKNPEWMLVSCPVSCNQCKNKCDDNNVYCKDWADLGECTKNPDYMNIYCQKSCKKCKGDCEDENKSCTKWANKGYCKSGDYSNYMKLRCKSSCKLC